MLHYYYSRKYGILIIVYTFSNIVFFFRSWARDHKLQQSYVFGWHCYSIFLQIDSPIPPRRTTSRVQIQNELQSQPPEIPPRYKPSVETEQTPTENTSTTTPAEPNPDILTPFEEGIRERIPPEINAEIVDTIAEINERDFQFSKLKLALGVVAVTLSVGLFYVTFF